MNDLVSGADYQNESVDDSSVALANQHLISSAFQVHAILITHDGARWLPELLSSLQQLTIAPHSVRAVDTGSLDRSRELLAQDQIKTLLADRDTGFGEAVQLAVADVLTENEDVHPENHWLWLLHDDCAPLPECLEELLVAVSNGPSVAVAGPKVRGWHDRNHLLEMGVSIAGNGARWTGLERRERDQGQHDHGLKDVLAVGSAGALIRLDVWQELSGFDPHLTMFRDDVDFGWRVNVAGHRVISVPKAILLHAEAAATERRVIDVDGAPLHRPHLLDRRHANYVLLVNCSRWRLPTVLARLIVSTIVRAVGYLFAKLPGYAGDEVAALALFLARLDLIRSARRQRSKTRLLQPTSVLPYLAPDRSQIQEAFTSFRELIFRGRAPLANPSTSFDDAKRAVGDDEEELPSGSFTLLKRIVRVPWFSLGLAMFLLTLFASRSRWGGISGGALFKAPEGARDLLAGYFDSWHTIGIGSSNPAPPWFVLVAMLSLFTLGNLHAFVWLLFLFTPVLSALSLYAIVRKRTKEAWVPVAAGIVYGVSPILLTGFADGQLTLMLALIIAPPGLVALERAIKAISLKTPWSQPPVWRALAMVTLLIALAPQLTGLYAIGLLALVLLIKEQTLIERFSILIIGVTTPFLLLFPWSLSAILHPTLWLQSFGISPQPSEHWKILSLGNGGFTAAPWWFGIALAIGMVLVTLRTRRTQVRLFGVIGLLVLVYSMIVSLLELVPFGEREARPLWVGPTLVVATCIAVIVVADGADGLLARLQQTPLSRIHFESLVIATSMFVCALSGGIWLAASQFSASEEKTTPLPAFISAALTEPERPRVLTVAIDNSNTKYAVIRERDLQLGDPELSGPLPTPLDQAVNELLNGGSAQTAGVLAEYAIGYVLVINPVPDSTIRVLDGVGGLRRISQTSRGVLWKITTPTARATFISESGTVSTIPSNRISVSHVFDGPGLLKLSEKQDSGWQLLIDGKVIQSIGKAWNNQFKVTSGQAILVHESSRRRAALGVEFLAICTLMIMCLPAGRRWIDKPDEEVA